MRLQLGTGHRLFVAFALHGWTFAFASVLALEHVRSFQGGLPEGEHRESAGEPG